MGTVPQLRLRSWLMLHCGCCAAGFPQGSLWHGRSLPERVKVEWGQHSMVDATRALLRNALKDPLNQKFILLSEAGIPLYPPDVLYHQLITEDKSRLHACVTPTVRCLHNLLLLHALYRVHLSCGSSADAVMLWCSSMTWYGMPCAGSGRHAACRLCGGSC